MKFTSILFTLVASLFLVDSTLALPAPWGFINNAFSSVTDAVKELDVSAMADLASKAAKSDMGKVAMKHAADKVPGGYTALELSKTVQKAKKL
jgi:hypothetical protein